MAFPRQDHINFIRQLERERAKMMSLSSKLQNKALDEIATKWGRDVTDEARENLSGKMVNVQTGELLSSQGYITSTGKTNLQGEQAGKLAKPLGRGQVCVGNVAEHADLIHNGHGEITITPIRAKALRYIRYDGTPSLRVKNKKGKWKENSKMQVAHGGREVFSQISVIKAAPPAPFLAKAINTVNQGFVQEAGQIVDRFLRKGI